MNKKKLILSITMIFCFFFFLNTVNAIPDSITKIFEAYRFSLGGSFCQSLECDRASLFFLLPMDKNYQEVDLYIFPTCFTPLNSSDVLNLTIWCSDGTKIEYDMKTDYCLSSDHNLNIPLKLNGTGGFVFFGEKQFQQFWCAFKRNPLNTEKIPTEFSVMIDGVGLHSKYITINETQTLSAQSQMSDTLGNFVELNMMFWRMGYNLFLVFAIIFGIFIVLGAVPLVIKWVIRKITED